MKKAKIGSDILNWSPEEIRDFIIHANNIDVKALFRKLTPDQIKALALKVGEAPLVIPDEYVNEMGKVRLNLMLKRGMERAHPEYKWSRRIAKTLNSSKSNKQKLSVLCNIVKEIVEMHSIFAFQDFFIQCFLKFLLIPANSIFLKAKIRAEFRKKVGYILDALLVVYKGIDFKPDSEEVVQEWSNCITIVRKIFYSFPDYGAKFRKLDQLEEPGRIRILIKAMVEDQVLKAIKDRMGIFRERFPFLLKMEDKKLKDIAFYPYTKPSEAALEILAFKHGISPGTYKKWLAEANWILKLKAYREISPERKITFKRNALMKVLNSKLYQLSAKDVTDKLSKIIESEIRRLKKVHSS